MALDQADSETWISRIEDKDFWRAFAPELTIGEAPVKTKPVERNKARDAKLRRRLISEGYLCLTDMDWEFQSANMAKAMITMKRNKLPAAFIGVFDEPWVIAAQLRTAMDNLLDSTAQLVPDFWGWVVNPGQEGFDPHRDRPEGSIDKNGLPLTVAVWMPLTPATPENAGMYVIPANYDVQYLYGDGSPQVSLQDTRAVPSLPGDVLIWTGRTYHWGGRASSWSETPRVSMAWEFQTSKVDPVERYILDSYPDIPFDTRLGLIGRQMQFYKERESGGQLWDDISRYILEKYPLDAHENILNRHK
jgi:hypothetical protein